MASPADADCFRASFEVRCVLSPPLLLLPPLSLEEDDADLRFSAEDLRRRTMAESGREPPTPAVPPLAAAAACTAACSTSELVADFPLEDIFFFLGLFLVPTTTFSAENSPSAPTALTSSRSRVLDNTDNRSPLVTPVIIFPSFPPPPDPAAATAPAATAAAASAALDDSGVLPHAGVILALTAADARLTRTGAVRTEDLRFEGFLLLFAWCKVVGLSVCAETISASSSPHCFRKRDLVNTERDRIFHG